MSDIYTIGSWIGANLVGLAAVLIGMQRALKLKDDKLAASKMETIQVLQANRDAWKAQFEDEHTKYEEYRIHTHKQIDEANNKLLKATEDIAQLRIKTDMTPVMDLLLRMTKILDVISERLNISN